MKHSERESFFWLNDAALLASVEHIKRVPKSRAARVEEYRAIQHSRDTANTLVIALARREVSIDELDDGTNIVRAGQGLTIGDVRLCAKKAALAHIAATGDENDRIVQAAMSAGVVTHADVARAIKRNRAPAFDAERVSLVARVLVQHWCGDGTAGSKLRIAIKREQEIFCAPPLCFFDYKPMVAFLSLALHFGPRVKGINDAAIRKWVSRLGLKPASSPRIREVRINGGEILFLP
jgi:hypothetical protein